MSIAGVRASFEHAISSPTQLCQLHEVIGVVFALFAFEQNTLSESRTGHILNLRVILTTPLRPVERRAFRMLSVAPGHFAALADSSIVTASVWRPAPRSAKAVWKRSPSRSIYSRPVGQSFSG